MYWLAWLDNHHNACQYMKYIFFESFVVSVMQSLLDLFPPLSESLFCSIWFGTFSTQIDVFLADRLFLEKVDSSANNSTVVRVKLLFPLTSPSSSPHPWRLNWWEIWVQLYILLPASPLSFSSPTYHPSHWAVTTKERGKYSDDQQWAICVSFFVLNSRVYCF